MSEKNGMWQIRSFITIVCTIWLMAGPILAQPPTPAAPTPAPSSPEKPTDHLVDLYARIEDLKSKFKYAEALPLAEEAFDITLESKGPKHPDLKLPLSIISQLHKALGHEPQAQRIDRLIQAIEQVDTFQETATSDPITLAQHLENLAKAYQDLGRISITIDVYNEGLDALGNRPISPTADIHDALGAIYAEQGRFFNARSHYANAVSIRKQQSRLWHPDLAESLFHLGQTHHYLGDLRQAEIAYWQSMKIWDHLSARFPGKSGKVWSRLGMIALAMGNLETASSLFQEAERILTNAYGVNHLEVAMVHHAKGVLEDLNHRPAMAETHYQQAGKIFGQIAPEGTVAYIDYLTDFAGFRLQRGDRSGGQKRIQQALTMAGQSPTIPDFMVRHVLSRTVEFCVKRKDYGWAHSLFQHTRAAWETALGPNHPHVVWLLDGHGRFLDKAGDSIQAAHLFHRALNLSEATLGPDHPVTIACQVHLADHYASTGNYFQAESRYKNAMASLGKSGSQETFHRSDILYRLARLYVRMGQYHGGRKYFEQAIDLETQLLSTTTSLWQSNRDRIHKIGNWDSYLEFLSQHLREDPSVRKNALAIAQLQKMASMGIDPVRTDMGIGPSIGAPTLTPGSALVAYVRISTQNKYGKLSDKYLAVIVNQQIPGSPWVIDLGNGASIDQAVAQYKRHLTSRPNLRDPKWKPAANTLWRMVFKPVTPYIQHIKTLHVVPAGSLNLIPFEVLLDDQDRFLVETNTFVYHGLSSGIDDTSRPIMETGPLEAVVMADPDPNYPTHSPKSHGSGTDLPQSIVITGICPQLRSHRLSAPSVDQNETDLMQVLFANHPHRILTGKEATESNLFQQPLPAIVHLAVPVFAKAPELPATFQSSQKDADNFTLYPGNAAPLICRNRNPETAFYPLLNSGILLTGFHRAFLSHMERSNDGVVSAQELAQAPFQNTQWIVLPRCGDLAADSGTGRQLNRLRLILTGNGKRRLIMALWQMDDHERLAWLSTFYSNILSGRFHGAEACRHTNLERMASIRLKFGVAHPGLWGGFTYSGN